MFPKPVEWSDEVSYPSLPFGRRPPLGRLTSSPAPPRNAHPPGAVEGSARSRCLGPSIICHTVSPHVVGGLFRRGADQKSSDRHLLRLEPACHPTPHPSRTLDHPGRVAGARRVLLRVSGEQQNPPRQV